MSIRQPHKCSCFGGACWKNFCPNNEKKDKKKKKKAKAGDEVKKDRRNEPTEILTWHPPEDKE